jgi:hypothetical protein
MKLARKCIIAVLLFTIATTGISSLHIGTTSASLDIPTNMPYVFVYPRNIVAEPGENFTITVAVFNLTPSSFRCIIEWNIGDPLPPYDPNGIHIYPMGFMVGFDLHFSWDPNILDYVNHTVTVPYESYPTPTPIEGVNFTGTLHSPVTPVKDIVNATLGTYWLAKASGINYFNGNGTLFKMTFHVKREGGSPLALSDSKLAAPAGQFIGQTYNKLIIPNGVLSGYFLTSGAKTRVYSLDVEASVGINTFSPPIIDGENATVMITMHNDGAVTDDYNLTLYHKLPSGSTETVTEWLNQTINATQSQSFEVPILHSSMARGNHVFMANATILHVGETSLDSQQEQVAVITADLNLTIAPLPQDVYKEETVTFDATGSNHSEPTGYFTLYTWEIRESPTAPVRFTVTNSTPTAQYAFPSALNFTVSLIVTDNFGITYDANRPATARYKKSFTVEVTEKPQGGFPWDLLALAIILVAVIVIVGYIYMRRRR